MNAMTTKQWMQWQQNNDCNDNKTMNGQWIIEYYLEYVQQQ